MNELFRIPGRAFLSTSGGRTSGLLLRRVLDAYHGTLPPDVIPVFCNTGKEFPATLDFVRDMGERWGVAIRWLEYDPTSPPGFRGVTWRTASRDGTPFRRMMDHERYVPNVSARICTKLLKIKTAHAFARSLGWADYAEVIGLRADEPRRVAKLKARVAAGEDLVAPLARAGVTKPAVLAFWRTAGFDLRLAPGESNCDLCFLKGWRLRLRIMQDHPDAAAWWVTQEQLRGHRFDKTSPSYARIAASAGSQRRLPLALDGAESEAIDCACTD